MVASTGATAGRAAVPAPVALLERDEELARLRSALRRAGQGRGGVALVYGEAGIGKTSLVAAFSAEAAHSARVLTGSCDDLLTPRTLGPFRDMGRVKSRFGLTVTDSGADRDAVFGALMDELTGSPTVLVIEDVHWADESTLDVLRLLVRRIPELPALAVLTYRDDALTDDDPLRRVLGGLRGDATTRLALRRLTRAAVVALAGERGADGAAVFDATEGNPFFISAYSWPPPRRTSPKPCATPSSCGSGMPHRLPRRPCAGCV